MFEIALHTIQLRKYLQTKYTKIYQIIEAEGKHIQNCYQISMTLMKQFFLKFFNDRLPSRERYHKRQKCIRCHNEIDNERFTLICYSSTIQELHKAKISKIDTSLSKDQTHIILKSAMYDNMLSWLEPSSDNTKYKEGNKSTSENGMVSFHSLKK